MCILSCPLPAPRVFSQLHLLARSHDLLDLLSTPCLLPKEVSGSVRTVLETAWKPFRTVLLALRSEELHAWARVHPSSRGSSHRPHLTLPNPEELVGAQPSPHSSEEPRDDLSLRSRPHRTSFRGTAARLIAPRRSQSQSHLLLKPRRVQTEVAQETGPSEASP